MDLQFVIDHLRAARLPLRQIGGVVGLDAAVNGVVTPPALFVLPLSERTQPAPLVGVHREEDTAEFGAMLCVSNVADMRGQAAINQLAPLRQAVRAALSGWAPAQCDGRPITKLGGQLVRMDGDARLWWLDRFEARFTYDTRHIFGACP